MALEMIFPQLQVAGELGGKCYKVKISLGKHKGIDKAEDHAHDMCVSDMWTENQTRK